MAIGEARGCEVGPQDALLFPADTRHGKQRAAARRDRERGRAVVRQPAMPFARIGERDAQARDRNTAETYRGVEHRPDLDTAEPEASRGPDDAGAHRHDRRVGTDDVPRDRERAVHGDGFVVAAERVAARDRRVDEVAFTQLPHEIGECKRQRRAIGHHVREAPVGTSPFECRGDCGHLAVQRGRHHRHPVDGADVGQVGPVLLAAAHVGLQARVPRLHDVPGPGFRPRLAREVPVQSPRSTAVVFTTTESPTSTRPVSCVST